jgi:hypothetical protein
MISMTRKGLISSKKSYKLKTTPPRRREGYTPPEKEGNKFSIFSIMYGLI